MVRLLRRAIRGAAHRHRELNLPGLGAELVEEIGEGHETVDQQVAQLAHFVHLPGARLLGGPANQRHEQGDQGAREEQHHADSPAVPQREREDQRDHHRRAQPGRAVAQEIGAQGFELFRRERREGAGVADHRRGGGAGFDPDDLVPQPGEHGLCMAVQGALRGGLDRAAQEGQPEVEPGGEERRQRAFAGQEAREGGGDHRRLKRPEQRRGEGQRIADPAVTARRIGDRGEAGHGRVFPRLTLATGFTRRF